MSSEFFDLLRIKNNAMAESTARKLKESPPSSKSSVDMHAKQLEGINLLIKDHLSEMTEWEVDWCYSNKHFLITNPSALLSVRATDKLVELLEMYATGYH